MFGCKINRAILSMQTDIDYITGLEWEFVVEFSEWVFSIKQTKKIFSQTLQRCWVDTFLVLGPESAHLC